MLFCFMIFSLYDGNKKFEECEKYTETYRQCAARDSFLSAHSASGLISPSEPAAFSTSSRLRFSKAISMSFSSVTRRTVTHLLH